MTEPLNVEQAAARLQAALRADPSVAFGDSPNDLEMTNVAAISYCMANGSDDLKARCDRVCPAVTEDGIAIAFRDLGLI